MNKILTDIITRNSFLGKDGTETKRIVKELSKLIPRWNEYKIAVPEPDTVVRAIIEHWKTKNRYETHLVKVNADDRNWKVWDAGYEIENMSELDMAWNVICWQHIPPFPKDPKPPKYFLIYSPGIDCCTGATTEEDYKSGNDILIEITKDEFDSLEDQPEVDAVFEKYKKRFYKKIGKRNK